MLLKKYIPFGLKVEDNTLIDVADVLRGKQCGCICPSCNIPLIAKKGNINRWHFSHFYQNTDPVDKECEFSFFVSVRAMAKQLIDTTLLITLPEWHDKLIERRHGIVFFEDYYITNSRDICFDSIQKEYSFESAIVDIYGNIDKHSFLIYFTHPGRKLPENLSTLELEPYGILEIKLDNTIRLFQKNTPNIRFIDQLKDFLQHDNNSKRWIFHPRKRRAALAAKKRLDERLTNYIPPLLCNQEEIKQPESWGYPKQEKGMGYQCLICQCIWVGRVYEELECPECHRNYLYIKNV